MCLSLPMFSELYLALIHKFDPFDCLFYAKFCCICEIVWTSMISVWDIDNLQLISLYSIRFRDTKIDFFTEPITLFNNVIHVCSCAEYPVSIIAVIQISVTIVFVYVYPVMQWNQLIHCLRIPSTTWWMAWTDCKTASTERRLLSLNLTCTNTWLKRSSPKLSKCSLEPTHRLLGCTPLVNPSRATIFGCWKSQTTQAFMSQVGVIMPWVHYDSL